MIHYTRIQALLKVLKEQSYSDLLISNPTTIAYLTNYYNLFPGERIYLLHLSANGTLTLYLNKLFPTPNVDTAIQTIWYNDGETILNTLATKLQPTGKIGVDKDWASQHLLTLMALLPQATFNNGSPLSDTLRSIKSTEEQTIMKQASYLNDQAMNRIIQAVPQGLPESQMVQLLSQTYKDLACNGFSFDPIIAYGANGADPHHETNHDQPKIGDSVIIDIGSFYKGYASDMTRTVFYGEPSAKAKEIYHLVKKANEAAIQQVKPGVTFASIDKAARDVIEQGGYGEYFTHRTGHSIGMEVHEPGDVGAANFNTVSVGNVFSIEPGIYIPGELGVRIEDLVVVTENGCEVLNKVTKDLIICEPE